MPSWKVLHRHWPDVMLSSRWADGFPVMSEEIRGLLHATAGQGRTELITPPQVPEQDEPYLSQGHARL